MYNNNNNIDIKRYERKKVNKVDEIILGININSCKFANKDIWWYDLQNILSDHTAVVIINIIANIIITDK